MTTPTPERAAQPQSRGEHTAGPWQLRPHVASYGIAQANGHTFAYLSRQFLFNDAEYEANAQLLVRAPELAAMLRETMAWISTDTEEGKDAWLRANAILAKVGQPQ